MTPAAPTMAPAHANGEGTVPRSRSGFVLAVLMTIFGISFIDRQILALLIAPIKSDLSLSDTQIGLLQGLAFALLYMFFGLPFGRLADRFNRRNIIVGGVAVWSIATVGCGAARNFWQLFALRIGVGVGEASLQPAAYSLIADYFPAHRLSLALSIFSIGAWLGVAMAFLIGGNGAAAAGIVSSAFGSSFSGWRVLFVLVGLAGVPACLLLLRVREPQRATHLASQPISEAVRFLVRRASCFGPLFLGYALLLLCTYALLAWGPAMLMRTYGWTPPVVGNRLGLCVLLFSPLGLLAGGLTADRLVARGRSDGPILVGIAEAVLLLPAMVGLAAAPSGTIACLLLAICFFVGPMSLGSATAAVQLLTPQLLRGQVSAAYLIVVSIVGIAGGPFVTALATDYVFRNPVRVNASIALVAGITLPFAAFFLAVASRAARKPDPARPSPTPRLMHT